MVVIEHNLDVIKTADYIIDISRKLETKAELSWQKENRRKWRILYPID